MLVRANSATGRPLLIRRKAQEKVSKNHVFAVLPMSRVKSNENAVAVALTADR